MRPASPGRWCETHRRLECTRQRSRGRGQCHAPAIRGANACRFHAGKTAARARRDAYTAWAAVPGDDGISPVAAVAGELNLSWRLAAWYGAELARLTADPCANPDVVAMLTAQWDAERDRCVRFAAIAHSMGMAERQVDYARTVGGLMYALSEQLLDALGLSEDQAARIPEVMPRLIRALPDTPPDDAA